MKKLCVPREDDLFVYWGFRAREKTIEKLRFARKSKTLAEIGQTKQA